MGHLKVPVLWAWNTPGNLQIWFLHDHTYFITPWEKPAFKCDWFTHQGDHFTILTGLARSRLKTLCKWKEANISDVLLTCWANNFSHQQFYVALLVPTVKLTMHSISIRQENDPHSPCFFFKCRNQRCAKKHTVHLEGIFAFLWNINNLWLMNTIHQSQLFESLAFNVHHWLCWIIKSLCENFHAQPLLYLSWVTSRFLILACVACSHVNSVPCTLLRFKGFWCFDDVTTLQIVHRYFFFIQVWVCVLARGVTVLKLRLKLPHMSTALNHNTTFFFFSFVFDFLL